MRSPLMPNEETPLPPDSESLRESIRRLSAQSERLREDAKRNAEAADRIVQQIAEIEKRLIETREAKKSSGRIS